MLIIFNELCLLFLIHNTQSIEIFFSIYFIYPLLLFCHVSIYRSKPFFNLISVIFQCAVIKCRMIDQHYRWMIVLENQFKHSSKLFYSLSRSLNKRLYNLCQQNLFNFFIQLSKRLFILQIILQYIRRLVNHFRKCTNDPNKRLDRLCFVNKMRIMQQVGFNLWE